MANRETYEKMLADIEHDIEIIERKLSEIQNNQALPEIRRGRLYIPKKKLLKEMYFDTLLKRAEILRQLEDYDDEKKHD